MVGAVLQFDSRSTKCDASLLNEFEVHLLVEYIGVLVSGASMVSMIRCYPWTDIDVYTTHSGWP